MNTAANIAHTLQDCLNQATNLKIEQLCELIQEVKDTEFYSECQKVWHLATVSPSTFALEIDCLLAEYPF
jgi:hypothetical protein